MMNKNYKVSKLKRKLILGETNWGCSVKMRNEFQKLTEKKILKS